MPLESHGLVIPRVLCLRFAVSNGCAVHLYTAARAVPRGDLVVVHETLMAVWWQFTSSQGQPGVLVEALSGLFAGGACSFVRVW